MALTRLERRAGEEVEAVFHDLLVRPAQARRRFAALYAEAEERVDLTRGQDLIDVLTERVGLLGPTIALLRNDYRRRLRARAMWLDDWYRSARFLLPQKSSRAIEALLAGKHGRVLSLWGGGGMGKTSHLRWLIARRCEPEHDACASLDFDSIDLRVASREPWLLLLEAAGQLDQQLLDAPFYELLAQCSGERDRIRPEARAMASSDVGAVEHEAMARDVFERFVAGLGNVPDGGRIIIALDTLEDALMSASKPAESALQPILEQFARLIPRVPELRLVLAGRYDLGERAPECVAQFPGRATLRLTSFSPSDARRYLKVRRGITRRAIVEQVVVAADGMPLKLELIADVAEEHPEWFELKRYAGSASWVTLDPLETDVVRFRPEVLSAMRSLLRADRAHDEIHRRAAKLFAERAERDSDQATRWLTEAVYHRFQLQGPAVEPATGLMAETTGTP